MSIHFIGVDAGGTSTRAMVATEDGTVVDVGRAPGANSWSSGASPSETVVAAVRDAIGSVDPGSVAGSVIAIAGGGASAPEIAAEFEAGWGALGVPRSPRVVVDVVAAYAAGTVTPRGLVLAAGTGAIAAVVADGRLQRRSGGHGWLVGDEGSAVWLGVEAVRAVLMSLDGRGPETSMLAPVCAALGVVESDPVTTAMDVVSATYSRPPAHLGQLAPLVVEAGEASDRVAGRLLDDTTGHLAALAMAAAADEDPAAIVLAGSLLTRVAPIRVGVRDRLLGHWPGATLTETVSGETGAVALAILDRTGRPVSADVLDRLRRRADTGP